MKRKTTRKLLSVMLRKLFALSGTAFVILCSIMGFLLYEIEYRNSRTEAAKAAESAGGDINLLVDSLNNISSMIIYSSVSQEALSARLHGQDRLTSSNINTLFASTAQYIRLIDNFILLDSHYDYFTSMFILSDEMKQQAAQFVKDLPQKQKNGRVNWYVLHGDQKGKAAIVRSIHSTTSASVGSIGYLVIMLNMQELYEEACKYRFCENSEILIMSSDGMVLYDQSGVNGRKKVEIDSLFTDKNHCGYTDVDGVPVLAACSGKLDNGWRIVELTPQSAIFYSVLGGSGWMALIFLIVTMIFGMVLVLISRSVTAPFEKMQQAMESIGKGNFNIPDISLVGISEVDSLRIGFQKMSAQLNEMIEEVYRARIRENELELSAQQSEIEMLQQQINPHFLYNTLDSINWMASLGATDVVSKMIIALSNFFRFTVSEHSAFTQISKETEFAKNYVYLQKCRFGSTLEVKINVEPQAEEYLTLRLLLQPLIENAIEHGIMRGGHGGTIWVDISLHDGMIFLEVQDNGAGMDEKTLQSISENRNRRSIGLPNIRRRLELVYENKHVFKIKSKPGQGTKIEIAFPAVHTEKDLHCL